LKTCAAKIHSKQNGRHASGVVFDETKKTSKVRFGNQKEYVVPRSLYDEDTGGCIYFDDPDRRYVTEFAPICFSIQTNWDTKFTLNRLTLNSNPKIEQLSS